MKIFFDTSAMQRAYGGISIYSASLLRNMMTTFPEREYHTGCKTLRRSSFVAWKRRTEELLPSGLHTHWKRLPGRLSLGRLTAFQTEQYDIVHITNNICFPYSRVSTWKNVILTVHDMLSFQTEIPILRTPDYEYVRQQLPRQAARARKIITVSEFSKREICRLLGLPPEKIAVVPDAPQEMPAPDEEALDRFHLKKRGFFLAVGSFYPHKNYPTLIRAFREYVQLPSYGGERLVIVGCPDRLGSGDELRLVSDPHIRLLKSVSPSELAALYTYSAGLFQLSLYEGFGMPVLEAMFAGCPVCCTKDSAMTEVAGETAFAVDAQNIAEIVSVFELFSRAPDEVKKRAESGSLRAGTYSWERTARETMAVYETLAMKSK